MKLLLKYIITIEAESNDYIEEDQKEPTAEMVLQVERENLSEHWYNFDEMFDDPKSAEVYLADDAVVVPRVELHRAIDALMALVEKFPDDEGEQRVVERCAANINWDNDPPKRHLPPVRCENEALEGSDYCAEHQHFDDIDDEHED